MTQRQILHAPGILPNCPCGQLVRHYHDLRKAEANGGHFLECAPCDRRTDRHRAVAGAIEQWCRMHDLPLPKPIVAPAPMRRIAGYRA